MKTKCVNWLRLLAFGCAMMILPACNDDPMGKGDVDFEITDAPSDDASVDAVMVTVSDIMIDGRSVSGFSKQTINLKAYQEGKTKLLASAKQVDARTYNYITLVLDLETDANGNSPGCYVRTIDGAKYQLRSTVSGKLNVALAKSWSVRTNAKTRIVMDFDLRKAIAYSSESELRYRFVSDNNLRAAVRVVAFERAGTIKGTFEESGPINADKIIVYAYKKGMFNASAETQAQGEDGILFANAVASAEVKQDLFGKTYILALLEEGEYELHFAAHTENEQTARLMFSAMLASETSFNGSVVNVVKVQGGATLNLSTNVSAGL